VPKMKFRVAFPIQMTRAKIVIEEAQKEYEVPDVKAFESVEGVPRYSATLFIDPHRRYSSMVSGVAEIEVDVVVGAAYTLRLSLPSTVASVSAGKAFKPLRIEEYAEVTPR